MHKNKFMSLTEGKVLKLANKQEYEEAMNWLKKFKIDIPRKEFQRSRGIKIKSRKKATYKDVSSGKTIPFKALLEIDKEDKKNKEEEGENNEAHQADESYKG